MEKEDLDLVALLLAIFLPPVGVAIKKGLGLQLVVNVVLTFLGYIPGIIHALYVILKD